MRGQFGAMPFRNSLRVLQWAISCGPERVQVKVGSGGISVEFGTETRPIRLRDFQRCLSEPIDLPDSGLRDLGFAILGMEGQRGFFIRAEGPEGGFHYDSSGTLQPLPGAEKRNYRCSVFMKEPLVRGGLVNLEHRSIEQTCQYSPVPIYVNGRLLQSKTRNYLLESSEGVGGVYCSQRLGHVRRSFHLSTGKAKAQLIVLKRGVVIDVRTDLIGNFPCRGTAVIDGASLKTDLGGLSLIEDENWEAEMALAKQELVSLAYYLHSRIDWENLDAHREPRKDRVKRELDSIAGSNGEHSIFECNMYPRYKSLASGLSKLCGPYSGKGIPDHMLEDLREFCEGKNASEGI
jgi:hypothetical protein